MTTKNTRSIPYKELSKSDKEAIQALYATGNSKMNQIATKFKISMYVLNQVFKELNITVKRTTKQVDETYFEKIDTSNKAYWLGLLYADGYVSEFKTRGSKQISEYKISLGLSGDDCYLVEQFRDDLKSDHTLVCVKAREVIRKDGKTIFKQKQTRLDIYNKKMFNDLVNLGLTPRKSTTCDFPKCMENSPFIIDFIRGYFDGDGYVQQNKTVGWIGTEMFNLGMCKQLDKMNITYTVVDEKRVENMNYVHIRAKSRKQFFTLLYAGTKKRYMYRKHNKAEELLLF